MELAFVLLCVLLGVTAILYAGLRPPIQKAGPEVAGAVPAAEGETASTDTAE